jgi:phosphate ABC transporter phosphate-binding protein
LRTKLGTGVLHFIWNIKTERELFGQGRRHATALFVWVLVFTTGAGWFAGSSWAQAAETLGQVKKVYVAPFGEADAGGKLRQRVVDDVRKRGKWEVVGAEGQADAVIKGDGSVWVTGYVSNDWRSPSNTRRPVYTGFLSAEVVGKGGEPLWSYLVTPSKFRVGTITDDLADHLVKKLADDLAHSANESTTGAAPGAARTEIALSAAGATFPAPLYQKWFESFGGSRGDARISYNAVGSEEGIRMLSDSKVDFAASDVPLANETASALRGGVLHFATVLGAVVPIYNLKSLDRPLNFTPDALAGIYLGRIRKWNDAAIRAVNRGVSLPDSDIVVVHRSDGSGTTFVWTDYLSKVNPEWKASVGAGSTVQWPAGEGAERNEGVADKVQHTPNAIGYVELVYALRHQLSYGAVRNAAGRFVQADLDSVTEAGNEAAGMATDFRVSITNAAGRGAYPIASFTWWLMPKDAPAEKRGAEVELLQWMLTAGQKDCSALGYAPLPRGVAAREMQAVGGLK